jgi:hypothetical protein
MAVNMETVRWNVDNKTHIYTVSSKNIHISAKYSGLKTSRKETAQETQV